MYFQWALRLVVSVILHHHQQKCIHYKLRTLTVYVITTKSSSTPPPTFFLSSYSSPSGVVSFIPLSPVSPVFPSSGRAFCVWRSPGLLLHRRSKCLCPSSCCRLFYIIRSCFRCVALTRSLPQSSLQVFVPLILPGCGRFGNVCF